MTGSDDKDRHFQHDDKRTQWWFIGSGLVLALAIVLAVFITHDNRTEQPARITPIPGTSVTTITETPATVTETPPITLTETNTQTSVTTVVVTRTEPTTTTITVTAPLIP